MDNIYIENITDYTNDIMETIYSSGVDFNSWLKEHDPLQFSLCYAQPEVKGVTYTIKKYPNGTVEESFEHPLDVFTKATNEAYEALKGKSDL